MPALSERTNLFIDSPIAKMSVLSEQYGAVNLSAGFPRARRIHRSQH